MTVKTLCALHVLCAVALAGQAEQAYHTVAFSGDQPPGYPKGTVWYPAGMRLNNTGQVLFHAYVVTDNPVYGDELILREETDGLLTTILKTGDQAPGFTEGVSFLALPYFHYGDSLHFNDHGDVAFAAYVDNAIAIYSSVGKQGLHPLAVAGQQAPGVEAGVVIDELWVVDDGWNELPVDTLELSNAGHVVFESYLEGPGFPGFVRSTPCLFGVAADAELAPIAIARYQVPGLPEGVTFQRFDLSYVARPITTLPQVNALGQTAFVSRLSGPGVTSDNRWAIFVAGRTVGPVLRSGEHAGGLPPEINYDAFSSHIALNDDGQLAFFAHLAGPDVDNFQLRRALLRSGWTCAARGGAAR